MAMGKIYKSYTRGTKSKLKSKGRIIKKNKKERVPWLISGGKLHSVKCAHVYTDRIQFDSATHAYGSVAHRIAHLYDPYGSVSYGDVSDIRNGQPRFRDELGALYLKYRVFAVKAEITFDNQSTAATDSVIAYAYITPPHSTDSEPQSADFVREHPYINSRKNCPVIAPSGSAKSQATIVLNWSEKELPLEDRINNESNTTSGPEDTPTLKLGVVNANDTAGTHAVTAHARITFYTEWSNPDYQNIS